MPNRPDPFREAQLRFAEGVRYQRADQLEAAEACYRRALAARPDYPDALSNLALVLEANHRPAEALALYRRVLAKRPSHAKALVNLGNLLRSLGNFAEARAHYDRAIAADPFDADAHHGRAILKKFAPGDPELGALEALVACPNLSPNDAATAHFALAKALEDTADYSRAFEHMTRANQIKRTQLEFDEKRSEAYFAAVTRVFTRELIEHFAGAGHPSEIPVFILGMPRSGSTLIERILASHPEVQTAGEITTMQDALNSVPNCNRPESNTDLRYPESIPTLHNHEIRRIGQAYISRLPALQPGKTRIIDKLPGNFFTVGLIRMVLPNAKIIHTSRDPMDTCLSCYSQLFQTRLGYTCDLSELGRYYRRYYALMNHWRSILPQQAMLEVRYEDVVADLESNARRIVAHCGLAWDDRCLNFQESAGAIRTASAVQVRQPLFRTSVERWRRYQTGLVPLLDELREIITNT